MRKVLFLFCLVALLAALSVWAADVSGTWALKMKNPQGKEETFDLVIKQSGEKLTIAVPNHPVMKDLAGTGTLHGDKITMKLKPGDMPFTMVFKGKVADNKITGTREMERGEGGGPSSSGPGGPGGGPGSGGPGGPGGGPDGGGSDSGGSGGPPPNGGQDGPPSNDFTAVRK